VCWRKPLQQQGGYSPMTGEPGVYSIPLGPPSNAGNLQCGLSKNVPPSFNGQNERRPRRMHPVYRMQVPLLKTGFK
jgi:hypothetical protein